MYFTNGPLPCVTHIVFLKRKSDRKKLFFAFIIGAYCSLKGTNFKAKVILAKVKEKLRTLITTKAEFIGAKVN